MNIREDIYQYIANDDQSNEVVSLKDLYNRFPNIRKNTIREMIRRLKNEDKVIQVKYGVYQRPDPNRVLKKSTPNISRIIQQQYMIKNNVIFGYVSGINFANKLGLTSQTASMETIISNNVSNKKRMVNIKNNRFIVNSPRVRVTNNNYKLLQVMDLFNNFDKVSEYDLKASKKVIVNYLSDLKLDSETIESIVSAYPMKAQLNFYKSGVFYELT